MEKKWTVCLTTGLKLCQYADKSRAEKHAASIGGVVKFCQVNPQRKVEFTGKKHYYRMVGLPQY